MAAAAEHAGRDVIDILTADHREVTALLDEALAETAPQRRRDLADQVIAELVRHSVAEETFVYPAMREHLPDGDQAVEHDTEEHKEIEQRLKQLESLDAGDADFERVATQLRRTLEDHVQDEEEDQFPQLRRHVPPRTLVEIGEKVETIKKMAPTRPHPSAPNNKLFHLLAGPGVGLVDRLRDRLSGRSTDPT